MSYQKTDNPNISINYEVVANNFIKTSIYKQSLRLTLALVLQFFSEKKIAYFL